MLEARALGRRFGERWVFRSINFTLHKGDGLIVTGQNGSGKSTLLRVIAGLLTPSEGVVSLPEGDPRLVLGLSALDIHLYAHLTVQEHIDLAASLRGVPSEPDLLNRIGLGDRKGQLASELSSGLRARVKLVLAVQATPPVLLLDEPGVSLDEMGRSAVAEICERQRERGCFIVATNDPLERRLGNLELPLAG